MSQKIRVALLMGGNSSEREVSLASGSQVLACLKDNDKYQVTVYDPATDLIKIIEERPDLDVAFLALHGSGGEDGQIQGFLELIDLPYTGSAILASGICMDKKISKSLYKIAGLPIAQDFFVYKENDQDKTEMLGPILFKDLGTPVVVKPVTQGSSVGLSIVNNAQELKTALADAFKYDEVVMIEKYLNGREFTVAVLGNKTLEPLPVIEIIPSSDHDFFDYSAKYEKDGALEICPANLSEKLTAHIQDLAIRAHKVLGCRGFSRTDFIFVEDKFFILETNTLPGLTEKSLLPKAASTYGLSFFDLIDKLITFTLE